MTILSSSSRTLGRFGSTAGTPRPIGPPQLMPSRPVPSVAELSARLYAAYQVDGGSVRLAGCTIEPQPIVYAGGQCNGNAIELFLLPSGEALDAGFIDELGLRNPVPVDRAVRIAAEAAELLTSLGRQTVAAECRKLGREIEANTGFVKIIWTRWAAGKLRFTIGAEFVELPFADWASRLKAPAWICPHSGQATFHLAATGDGRIVAAEEIATCQQTNRRMLRGELVTCSVTGQQVSRELTELCPATERPVLAEKMTVCPKCDLRVSPQAIVETGCVACNKLASIRKSDPRMCLVLGEHPGLDRWRRWRLAETPRAYVLEARSLVRRLLVVVDKQNLQATRLAERNCFRSAWLDIAADQRRDFLQ
jgi:hypothetical protein